MITHTTDYDVAFLRPDKSLGIGVDPELVEKSKDEILRRARQVHLGLDYFTPLELLAVALLRDCGISIYTPTYCTNENCKKCRPEAQ